MNDILIEAYKKLHGGEEPMETEEYHVASKILDEWNVPKLGEDLAKETLFSILKYTPFPSPALSDSIQGRAEEKIMELYHHSFEHGDDVKEVIKELEEAYWKEKAEKEKTGEKLNLK